MDRRRLLIIVAVGWIFVIYMMMTAPKPDQAEAKGKADKSGAQENSDSELEKGGDQDADVPAEIPQSKKTSEAVTDPAAALDGENEAAQTDSTNDAGDNGEAGSDEPVAATPVTAKRMIEQRFFSLGSLATDSPYRFLATFDNTAASLRRLELVQRHSGSDMLRYRDLEVLHGYLGHLDLIDETEGPRIQTIGRHTPADLAGLKVGDVITALNGETVANRLDLDTLLRSTTSGEEISIDYLRGTEAGSVTVSLMRQPLEVIRPDEVPKEFAFPFNQIRKRLSYGVSLFNPIGTKWEELGDMANQPWETDLLESSIKFYYPYKDEQEIKNAGFDFQVIKTFALIPVAKEEIDDVESMAYHLDLNIEVRNLSEEKRSLAYRIDGPNGLPTEDWWFAIKIHGDWKAMFSQAGARDIVASTEGNSFLFVGGPKIYSNAIAANKQKKIMIVDPSVSTAGSHGLNYLGVDSHYFVSALIPTDGEIKTPRNTYSAQALPQWIPLKAEGERAIDARRKKEAGWYRKIVPANFKAYFQFENPNATSTEDEYVLAPGEIVQHSYMIFAGPKEPTLLKKYEIGDVVTYGWFGMFSWPLVTLLHLFHALIGNYGIAIVLLTVMVRLAMMRFSRKMVVNTQMMQVLSPEIKAITERYKDDFQGKSRAQQELFKKYNYNPFSGCLVMLIQLPVFIGLYRGLSVDMSLRDEPLIPGVEWCSNLAGPDQLWRWQEDLPQFMSFLTDETGWLGPYFNLLPIISVILMLIQQKLFTPPPADEQQAFMQKMMTFMMVFIGVIFFKVPAGLCIYFITSTLWAVMEKKLIPPPQLPEHLQKRLDDLKALQAKEKTDGVAAGTYTNATTSAAGNSTRKYSERAKKKSQKNRRK
ncbi:MAG: YidC/Oxa1 family insertase periplasmic-domain containing protein [Pirellulaceae bacterium]|nr:YidC/Oxa1 family insertase periplasmic-domain containing protein [Pirellulaceae bacterium]